MNISVFGLGYVGVVTAACLANDGHRVIGVDIAESKVDMIKRGFSPISEKHTNTLIRKGVQSEHLVATTDAEWAVSQTDLAFVCVGTPPQGDGGLETRFVESVTIQIGGLLRTRNRPFLLVLRSTVLPGTVRSLLIPILERHSGRNIGDGYDVVFHPEFMREGTAVEDYYHPAKIVVGERVAGTGKLLLNLYDGVDVPKFSTSIEIAEAVKYVDNAFHALKITFANEIGYFCKSQGIDSREVMRIFRADQKLNISPSYLRPGFAFGGSCLPKDLRALLHASHSKNMALPLLESILRSNESQIERVVQLVKKSDPDCVGLVGLSFKPGTDDLRESPLVKLAKRLLDKGYKLLIYDELLQTDRLVGSNKAYIDQHLPGLSRLIVQSREDICDCNLVIIGHPVEDVWLHDRLRAGKFVIDLVGMGDHIQHGRYEGIAW